MILIRYLLIGLIVYLLVRSFMKYNQENRSFPDGKSRTDDDLKSGEKKISKSIGEYVDYEEVKEEK